MTRLTVTRLAEALELMSLDHQTVYTKTIDENICKKHTQRVTRPTNDPTSKSLGPDVLGPATSSTKKQNDKSLNFCVRLPNIVLEERLRRLLVLDRQQVVVVWLLDPDVLLSSQLAG